MKNKLFKIFVLAIIVAAPIFILCKKTFATDINSGIADKALYQGIYNCYTNGYIKNWIDSLNEYGGSSEPLRFLINDTKTSDGNFVPLVTGWKGRGYDVSDNGLSCGQLFNGGQFGTGGYAGNLLKAFGKNSPQIKDTDGVISLTEDMGYKVNINNDKCYSLNYRISESGSANTSMTNAVCQSTDGTFYAEDAGESLPKFIVSDQEICLYVRGYTSSQKIGCTSNFYLGNNNFSEEWLLSSVNKYICGSMKCNYEYYEDGPGGSRIKKTESIEFDSSMEGGSNSNNSLQKSSASFKDGSSSIAAMIANSFLSNNSIDAGRTSDILVSNLEKRILYQSYLTTYYKAEINCESGLVDGAFDGKLNWLDSDGKVKECHYEIGSIEHSDKKVNGIDASGYYSYESLDINSLIDAIKDLQTSYSESEAEIMKLLLTNKDNQEVDCLSSGAAQSLGWIICPVLSFATQVSQDLYDLLIEPALRIEPSLFQIQDGDNNDTYDAWAVFQGIANTLFIIFFLFVIFSQVTGMGIDNYGIKKILPKLIVTAVLINLSYVICVACVDLSNIVGNGVQSIFKNLSDQLTISATIGGTDIGNSIGSTMITAIAIGVAAYAAYVTVAAWILPLIVAVIGALISILFLFVLLAGREALVVVLTVISPLAFACYMLPNTKKLFDKYIKLGEVLLLLYPICGLMVAGGGFVSKLLLSVGEANEGLFNAFAAMIVSIVPIFFIPKVVKSSFMGIGRLGASLSGLGDRLSGRAKSGISKSGAYKAGQERLRENQTRWRAGIDENGKPLKMNFGRRLARGAFLDRNIARSRAQYNKDQNARLTEGLLMDSDYMANAAAHREVAASNEREKMYGEIYDRETDRTVVETNLRTALAGKDAEKASAALNSLIKKGGISEAIDALQTANWAAMDGNVRNRVVQTMGNSGVDVMKAYSTYRNTGGTASFNNWANGNVSALESTANTKNKTYAQYLQQQREHAIDNYSKDEMQFVKSLSGNLSTQMDNDYGRMIGSAMIHSNDAKAQAEVDSMVESYIGSGQSAKQLGRSAEELSTLRDGAAQAMEKGYIAQNPARSKDDSLEALRTDLDDERTVIIATPQLYGKLKSEAKRIYDI